MGKKFISVMFIIILTVTSILGSGVFYVISSAGSDVSLSVNPEFLSTEPDHVFTVNISIANVENLFKWSLSVSWDPAVIELDPASTIAVTEGPFLKDVGRTVFRTAQYEAGSGDLSYVTCELMQPICASGSGTLLTIRFKAVGEGETNITIGNSVLYDFNKQKIPHTWKVGHISARSVVHDVAVTLESPTRLILGESVSLNATVTNVGAVDEPLVRLAILVNSTEKESLSVPLNVGSSETLNFNWTPYQKGSYNITAYASPVVGETKTNDNYESLFVEVVSIVHDVAVSLQSPSQLILGQSTLLNITVMNLGSVNETNLSLSLFVNTTKVYSWDVQSLAAGAISKPLYFSWNPDTKGIYNVTAYVRPVAEETIKHNNKKVLIIHVVSQLDRPEILIVSDDCGYYPKKGTSLEEFKLALTSAGFAYDVWIESRNGTITDSNILSEYKIVIWTCGDYSQWVISPYEANAIVKYVRDGGNIVLEGEKIVMDQFALESGYPNYKSALVREIMQVKYIQSTVRTPGITIVEQHSITKELPYCVNWTTSPSWGPNGIKPTGKSFAVAYYINSGFSAVNVLDGTEIGTGSVVYLSFVLSCLPSSYREILVGNAVHWLKRFGVSTVISRIVYSSSNAIYFIYPDYANNVSATFDMIAGNMLYAICQNEQNQGLTKTEGWLLKCGEVNTSRINNSVVALFGNPYYHKSVRYYNSSGLLQITLHKNSTHYIFKNREGQECAAISVKAVESGRQDMFVVQAFTEANITFLVTFGLDERGSWAAGLCISRKIAYALRNYSEAFYIFQWSDQNGDLIPQIDEIKEIASAP